MLGSRGSSTWSELLQSSMHLWGDILVHWLLSTATLLYILLLRTTCQTSPPSGKAVGWPILWWFFTLPSEYYSGIKQAVYWHSTGWDGNIPQPWGTLVSGVCNCWWSIGDWWGFLGRYWVHILQLYWCCWEAHPALLVTAVLGIIAETTNCLYILSSWWFSLG